MKTWIITAMTFFALVCIIIVLDKPNDIRILQLPKIHERIHRHAGSWPLNLYLYHDGLLTKESYIDLPFFSYRKEKPIPDSDIPTFTPGESPITLNAHYELAPSIIREVFCRAVSKGYQYFQLSVNSNGGVPEGSFLSIVFLHSHSRTIFAIDKKATLEIFFQNNTLKTVFNKEVNGSFIKKEETWENHSYDKLDDKTQTLLALRLNQLSLMQESPKVILSINDFPNYKSYLEVLNMVRKSGIHECYDRSTEYIINPTIPTPTIPKKI